MHIETKLSMEVHRGPDSWGFIYIALGLALGLELALISMAFDKPWNYCIAMLLAAFTIWQFLTNGWLHNKLIGWKLKYEGKPWRR